MIFFQPLLESSLFTSAIFCSFLFLGYILSLAAHSLIEIHESTVEFRAVHASESRPSANRDTAGSAHSGTVHHQSIEADCYGDAELSGHKSTEFHHYHRSDGYALGEFFATVHHHILQQE